MLTLILLTFLSLRTVMAANPPDWPFDVTTIEAPDGSVTAKFVSLGATLTELWVKDKDGQKRDVVLGYDDPTLLLTDPDHPVFNPIVGRYANRIKNGTFSIPISSSPVQGDPGTYYIPTNDHDGANTLHSSIYGWDRRNFTLHSKSSTSVTYHFLDVGGSGFPGNVTAVITHSVSDGGILKTTVNAKATELTPIMLTQHVYWNLDAFKDNSSDILSHVLRVGASRYVIYDANLIPTGPLPDVSDTPFDFRVARPIGSQWNETVDLCGEGCQGYDHCFVYDAEDKGKGLTLWSPNSGIRLDVTTNQPAVQVYTGNWLNTPRKKVHGGPSETYGKWSAVAIEQEGLIDAINTPEWGVDQIYGPDRDFAWSSEYKFSVTNHV